MILNSLLLEVTVKTIRIIVFVFLSLFAAGSVAYHSVEIGQRIEEFSAQAQSELKLAEAHQNDFTGSFHAATAARATVEVLRAEQEKGAMIDAVALLILAGYMLAFGKDRKTPP